MPECPSCGAAVDADQQYCGECGEALSQEGPLDVANRHVGYELKSLPWGFALMVGNGILLVFLVTLRISIPDSMYRAVMPRLSALGWTLLLFGILVAANLVFFWWLKSRNQ